MKQCNTCKLSKDNTYFSRDKSRKDGLNNRCKECQSKLAKVHYLNNKSEYKQSQERNRDARRRFLQRAKEVPCADCGIQYPYWIMQFDHLHSKEFTIGTMGYHFSIKKLKQEVSKCDVVCANCHSHRTRIRFFADVAQRKSITLPM